MAELTTAKKIFLSFFCAFSLIAYVPLACAVGNDVKKDTDIAVAGEISTDSLPEEITDITEDANFAS